MEAVKQWVQYQTRKDMDHGTWTDVAIPFSSVARALEQAEYLREAYVNVRIKIETTTTTWKVVDGQKDS